jgi:hypothetical protein
MTDQSPDKRPTSVRLLTGSFGARYFRDQGRLPLLRFWHAALDCRIPVPGGRPFRPVMFRRTGGPPQNIRRGAFNGLGLTRASFYPG